MAKKPNRSLPDSATLILDIDRPFKPAVFLLALYFAAVAVRFLLGLKYTHGPVIIIDENLYINIAKSLALEGKLAYRGQPVDYLNIFYPLFRSAVRST